MARRSKTITVLLHVLAVVLACVSTSTPAAARRAATPAVVAASSTTHSSVARRQGAVAQRVVARVHESRRDGPPLATTLALPARARVVVPRAGEERARIDAKTLAVAPRGSIDRPTARGPPR